MSRDLKYIIEDMLHSSQSIILYTEGMDEQEFLSDQMLQDAVCMRIVVIGESASKIITHFPDTLKTHSHIKWHAIRGIRNRLTHGYFGVDMKLVWQTIQHELPALIHDLKNFQTNLT